MRIALLLAEKGYEEGGSPIGGVIIDNETRKIVGKGTTRWFKKTILTIMAKLPPRGMRAAWISARPPCSHP